MTHALTIEQLKTLYSNIGKMISTALDPDEVLDSVMGEIKKVFNPSNWSILRLDEASNELFFVRVEGIDAEKVEHIRLKVGEGIAGHVAQTGESVFVGEASKDKRFTSKVDEASGFTTESILAVPMKVGDKILGLIEVINRNDGEPFNEEELFVLETIADFSAIALTNASLYQNVVGISERDGLTGCYNRLKLDNLGEEWRSSTGRREGDTHQFISVYLIDLNDFKIVNDTEGHAAGDKILRDTSQALRQGARENDMIFRIGGDEFLLLAFHDSEKNMEAMVKEIWNRLDKTSTTLVSTGRFSIGVSSGDRAYLTELMARADESMYEDKKRRKNGRVR